MYQYPKETQYAIKGMVDASQPFDIEDIKSITETILKTDGDGQFFDPIVEKELKNFMMTMFEKGYMPGYYASTKFVCDETGPKIILEFSPENALNSLDLIEKPGDDGLSVKCTLHPQYKRLLKEICEKAQTTQDMMVRSILVRALNSIYDQLK